MIEALTAVTSFHHKHGFAVNDELKPVADGNFSEKAPQWCEYMLSIAATMRQSGNLNLLRAGLILEEAVETVVGLIEGDIVEAADGLADLMYVTLGTAVAFGIPIERVFDEVHSSNMTKSVAPVVPGEHRKGGIKGPEFVKADVAGVLRRAGRIK